MRTDPAVEDLIDIALAAITTGTRSRGGDDRSHIIKDRKGLDDRTDIVTVVFSGECDIYHSAK